MSHFEQFLASTDLVNIFLDHTNVFDLVQLRKVCKKFRKHVDFFLKDPQKIIGLDIAVIGAILYMKYKQHEERLSVIDM